MNIYKFKKFNQIYKYLIVGIINNLFNYFIFNISNFFFNNKLYISGILGFISGALVSYLLNSKFTFSTRKRSKLQLLIFIIIQVILVNLYSLLILVLEFFSFINIDLAWVLATISISAINFLLQKKLFKLTL